MKTICSIVIAVTLAGCVSGGARYDQSAIARIRPGVTTERDLVKWFGEPYRHDQLDSGKVKVIWQYTRVGVGVGIVEQHELFVTLRSDGRVDSFEERNK